MKQNRLASVTHSIPEKTSIPRARCRIHDNLSSESQVVPCDRANTTKPAAAFTKEEEEEEEGKKKVNANLTHHLFLLLCKSFVLKCTVPLSLPQTR